jgi:hypothetical protein
MGDHEEKRVFRSKYRTSLTPLTILLAILLLSICVGFVLPFGLTAWRQRGGPGFSLFLVNSPLGVLLGLAVASILYAVAYLWYEALVFDQDELRHRALPFPFIDRKPIRYDQISTVRQSMRGVLVIETTQGQSMVIRLGGYEGGWVELIGELRRRVAPGRLTDRTLETLWERTSADHWSLDLMILAAGLFAVALGLTYYQDRGRAGIAWNVAASTGYGAEIVDYALAEDGSVWLLEREGIPLSESERYSLVQQHGGEEKVWELPSILDLLPMAEERYTYPNQVLIDRSGHPWLNFRFLDRVLYFSETGWEWLQIPSSVRQGYIDNFIPSGGAFWGRQGDQLVVVEPMELGVWHIPGFEEEPLPKVELYKTVAGGLAMAFFPTGRAFISRLALAPEGLAWEEVKLWGDGKPQVGRTRIESGKTLATTSIWGTLYLLTWTEGGCFQGAMSVLVGASFALDGWAWAEVEVAHDCESAFALNGAVVDPHGRVWIAASQGLSVFAGLDFQRDGIGKGSLMESYTEVNSGYFPGDLGADEGGRVWSLDEEGRMLVWVDSRLDQLPSPMPAVLANLLGSDWMPLVLEYLGGVALLGILAVLWNANGYKGASKENQGGVSIRR